MAESEENVRRRAKELAIQHVEEMEKFRESIHEHGPALRGGGTLGFGTRRDGRVYPKGEIPTLDFRGRIGRIGVYEGIIDQFRKIARDNKLPEAYAFRLLNDVSNSTLQIRYHLTREQVGELKSVARELQRKAEGGE